MGFKRWARKTMSVGCSAEDGPTPVNVFKQIDADGDMALSRDEISSYLKQQVRLLTIEIILKIKDYIRASADQQGRDLILPQAAGQAHSHRENR
jgi:hypothetical protein